MSGSGPSVFGVFDRPGVAERAINILAGLDLGNVVLAESWERKKSYHAIRE
jgi:4-diphosphocytidyl-2C-methyl-D-erythritol kinase